MDNIEKLVTMARAISRAAETTAYQLGLTVGDEIATTIAATLYMLQRELEALHEMNEDMDISFFTEPVRTMLHNLEKKCAEETKN